MGVDMGFFDLVRNIMSEEAVDNFKEKLKYGLSGCKEEDAIVSVEPC